MPTQQKIIYAVLALSLAVNLFFIGAAGHTAMKWRAIKNDSGWIETRLDRAEEGVIRHLDGEDAELAQSVFETRRPHLLLALRELRAARNDFHASLIAETPDPQAIAAALDRSQAAAKTLNENLHGTVRDIGLGLSVEARQKIAAHMKRRRYED
ncbi:MAG: periplasmic heavy metal sensor [Parvibaculales bacterium]